MDKSVRARLVLIDLDGTLVDSVPDLARSVDAMMDAMGQPSWGEAKVRDWVGNGIERLVKRALTDDLHAEPEAVLFEQAMPIFMKAYRENNGRFSRLYPGVLEGLDALKARGLIIGCVTNKAAAFTEPLLKELGVFDRFAVVISGDTLPKKKPDPMPLLHAAEKFGMDAADCLMVGDSQHDVKAARAAGFHVICVSYGYNHGEDIRLAQPDAVIDSLAQLHDCLDG